MAARALWKGTIVLGEFAVPVKLYSAVQDQGVHFRLLHRKDRQPVRQVMVNSRTGKPVASEAVRRAFLTAEGELVILDPAELEALEPTAGRDIEVLKVLPKAAIDHRWYERAYYLGPDGDDTAYFALARALEDADQEALVHWVMRGREYHGALRVHAGHPVLVTLRHAEEVVPVASLPASRGKALTDRELKMARQLIGMLAADFDPAEYRDEYRDRVLAFVKKKARGERPKVVAFKPRPPARDLEAALEASVREARRA
jgi:DNA end-binding protein Ku